MWLLTFINRSASAVVKSTMDAAMAQTRGKFGDYAFDPSHVKADKPTDEQMKMTAKNPPMDGDNREALTTTGDREGADMKEAPLFPTYSNDERELEHSVAELKMLLDYNDKMSTPGSEENKMVSMGFREVVMGAVESAQLKDALFKVIPFDFRSGSVIGKVAVAFYKDALKGQ